MPHISQVPSTPLVSTAIALYTAPVTAISGGAAYRAGGAPLGIVLYREGDRWTSPGTLVGLNRDGHVVYSPSRERPDEQRPEVAVEALRRAVQDYGLPEPEAPISLVFGENTIPGPDGTPLLEQVRVYDGGELTLASAQWRSFRPEALRGLALRGELTPGLAAHLIAAHRQLLTNRQRGSGANAGPLHLIDGVRASGESARGELTREELDLLAARGQGISVALGSYCDEFPSSVIRPDGAPRSEAEQEVAAKAVQASGVLLYAPDGRVVLTVNDMAKKPDGNEFDLVGGMMGQERTAKGSRVFPGENSRAAALRETLEETGVELDPEQLTLTVIAEADRPDVYSPTDDIQRLHRKGDFYVYTATLTEEQWEAALRFAEEGHNPEILGLVAVSPEDFTATGVRREGREVAIKPWTLLGRIKAATQAHAAGHTADRPLTVELVRGAAPTPGKRLGDWPHTEPDGRVVEAGGANPRLVNVRPAARPGQAAASAAHAGRMKARRERRGRRRGDDAGGARTTR